MYDKKINRNTKDRKRFGAINAAIASPAIALIFAFTAQNSVAAEPTVIDLTQTPCQFVESENGVDHAYSSESADDCKTINAQSGEKRLADSQPLTLKEGSYIFRVTNKNVPYELGFYLRGSGLIDRAKLPNVSGGGLTTGATKDYLIELTAGDYVYSCPLNPTPDYRLIVE